jgi:hypothetical protein
MNSSNEYFMTVSAANTIATSLWGERLNVVYEDSITGEMCAEVQLTENTVKVFVMGLTLGECKRFASKYRAKHG